MTKEVRPLGDALFLVIPPLLQIVLADGDIGCARHLAHLHLEAIAKIPCERHGWFLTFDLGRLFSVLIGQAVNQRLRGLGDIDELKCGARNRLIAA